MKHSNPVKSSDKSNSRKSTNRIKKHGSGLLDIETAKERLQNSPSTSLWACLTEMGWWLQFPLLLCAILPVDEAVWLARLFDIHDLKRKKKKLLKGGYFLCTQKYLGRNFLKTNEVQKRVVRHLKSKGYIKTRQTSSGKRLVLILAHVVQADLLTAMELNLGENGGLLIPKNSKLSQRNDHSKTREIYDG